MNLASFLNKRIYVFNPSDLPVILWKCLILLLIIIEIYKLPIIASFSFDFSDDNFSLYSVLYYLLPCFLFLFDILFNCNIGFYKEGKIVKERKQIFKKYAAFHLWIDSIAILILILFENIGSQILYIGIVLRYI